MGLFRRRQSSGAQADFGWGPLGASADPDWYGSGSHPDRPNSLPRIPVGILQRSVGYQLQNGVALMDPGYSVPTASNVPYWQMRARQNPGEYTRTGGSADNPMNGAVASRMAQRTLGSQPTGAIAGPGMIAPGVAIHGE